MPFPVIPLLVVDFQPQKLERERPPSIWPALRRWMLRRRDFVTLAEAAFLFDIDHRLDVLELDLGAIDPYVDETRRRGRDGEYPLSVQPEHVEAFLNAPEMPETPADRDPHFIPFPPLHIVLR